MIHIVPTGQVFDETMMRLFSLTASHANRNINLSFLLKSNFDSTFSNAYNPYLDSVLNGANTFLNMHGIVPNITLNQLTQLAGLREITQTPYFINERTQVIYFTNTFIRPSLTYITVHIENVKTQNTSATGLNSTFKIPLQQGRNIISDDDTAGSIYYFNDVTFVQKLEITDSNVNLDQITVTIYDRYNNILGSSELDYSFSIEFEEDNGANEFV